jgi:hypothetical protein
MSPSDAMRSGVVSTSWNFKEELPQLRTRIFIYLIIGGRRKMANSKARLLALKE